MAKKPKHHGMSMSSGSSGSGGGSKSPREKRVPSGVVDSAIAPSSGNVREDSSGSVPVVPPMPVVLTWGTIVKFASMIVIPLLAGISFAIYFFHKANLHMEDPTVHLTRGERGKLETKIEAKAARNDLKQSITREMKLQTQGLKQDLKQQQRKQIKDLGDDLKKEQRTRLNKILVEVKKTRQDLRRQ